MYRKKILAVALLVLSGALTGLCLVFPTVGFLQWVTLSPAIFVLFWAIGAKSVRIGHFYLFGMIYFLSYYLVVLHWFLYLYPMEFAGVTKTEALVLVLICWLGLSLLQTVLFSLVFLLFGVLGRMSLLRRHSALLPILLAAQWTVGEWAQTLTWMGVPWGRLPLGQIECGVLPNSAALFGSYFLTFLLVAVNAYVAFAVLHLDRVRLCAALSASLLLFAFAAGAVGYLTAKPEEGRPVVVAAVQGNVSSIDKWSGSHTQKTMEVYERLTAEAADKGAEIVVFPETFLPYPMTEENFVGQYVKGLATTYHVTVLCGAFYETDAGEKNGLFAVYPDGRVDEVVYAKQRLVPFGEFVPWRRLITVLIPPLATMSMLSEDLVAGEDSALQHTPVGVVGGLICFDSIYEELTRAAVLDGAELICLSTNDSWFTDSAALNMHSAQARLRALESGRFVVRAANTGISSVISPDGSSHGEIPPLAEGVSIHTAYMRDGITLYTRIGNLVVWLSMAAMAAVPAFTVIKWGLARKRANRRTL